MECINVTLDVRRYLTPRALLTCLRPGGCFNKQDGLSERATFHCLMLCAYSRMVRPPVGWFVILFETASGSGLPKGKLS